MEAALAQPLLYLSLFFKRRREDYYRVLSRVRTDGDWEGWTAFFLEGVATIAEEAVQSARGLFALVSHDRGRVLAAGKASVVAARLFEELPRHPVVTITFVVKLLETTKPTAAKAIALLEEVAVLAETTGRRRDRTFSYRKYLDLLRVGTDLEAPRDREEEGAGEPRCTTSGVPPHLGRSAAPSLHIVGVTASRSRG